MQGTVLVYPEAFWWEVIYGHVSKEINLKQLKNTPYRLYYICLRLNEAIKFISRLSQWLWYFQIYIFYLLGRDIT